MHLSTLVSPRVSASATTTAFGPTTFGPDRFLAQTAAQESLFVFFFVCLCFFMCFPVFCSFSLLSFFFLASIASRFLVTFLVGKEFF